MILLFFSGILFFWTDFFLVFIFNEDYLIFSTILKLVVIAGIFEVLINLLVPLINARNKVKLILFLSLGYLTYKLPLFFIGLIFFGIEGGLVGIIIANIITFIIQLEVSKRLGIRLKLKSTILLYISFFISLISTFILKMLFFNNSNTFIAQLFALDILYYFICCSASSTL